MRTLRKGTDQKEYRRDIRRILYLTLRGWKDLQEKDLAPYRRRVIQEQYDKSFEEMAAVERFYSAICKNVREKIRRSIRERLTRNCSHKKGVGS